MSISNNSRCRDLLSSRFIARFCETFKTSAKKNQIAANATWNFLSIAQVITRAMLRLSCHIQNYAWGKLGNESKVAQLASHAIHPTPPIESGGTYAEVLFWKHIGAHSLVRETLNSDG